MLLKPDTFALTVLLALLTALGPLATDMYLPAMEPIRADLGGTVPSAQLTLSLFLAGFAVGQLVYGPISDRHGRRGVLLASLAVVLVANAACVLAPNMTALIVARLAVGLGTAGPIVLARSIVRDLYSGARAGQELSRMGSIMGLVPAIGPLVGALVYEAAGWRMIFALQFLLAAVTAAVVFAALPETIGARRRPDPLRPATLLRTYADIVRHPVFALYTATNCFVFGGFFAFIATAGFLLPAVYGSGSLGVGLAFGMVAVAFVTGTLIGARLVGRIGIDRTMLAGVVVLLQSGGMIVLLVFDSVIHVSDILVPMMVYGLGLGIAFPQGIAGAIGPFPDRAGAASSAFGFLQMTFGALLSLWLAGSFAGSAVPFAVTVLMLAIGALLAQPMLWLRRRAAAE